MLKETKETECVDITPEHKFFRNGRTWVKRSSARSEWLFNPYTEDVVVPRYGRERALNEAASMEFIAKMTNIPVPELYCYFEDQGTVYLIMEYIEGVRMDSLNADDQRVVELEIEVHLATMKKLKSNTWGGPSKIVLPPYRVLIKEGHADQEWNMKPLENNDLVFCHNDLSARNVIVDPKTLKVKAIIDWEHAGFYPPEFEIEFYKRKVAEEGEEDDVKTLQDIMSKHRLVANENAN